MRFLRLLGRDQRIVRRNDTGTRLASDLSEILRCALIESGQPDVGCEFLHCMQRPEVERLQDDARFEPVPADGIEYELHKFLRRRCVLRVVGEDFRLDVEVEFAARG